MRRVGSGATRRPAPQGFWFFVEKIFGTMSLCDINSSLALFYVLLDNLFA